ncbi:MAG: ROK family protein [Candidatus Pseudobacter hemicellulosilyticus]|uniref:ROK family protein n=1 Tax=Candidatus Pseudobacter hemicellulosilyticus TaxID=3121375 RepID=A0AAJ5WM95_9BACT|nr:MAG: ROK family protein [Pseudobacter sp.]
MYRIGIDLGGTIIKVGLLQEGVVVSTRLVNAFSGTGMARTLPFIEAAMEELLAGAGVSREAVAGIGLAFPGLVNPETKTVISTNQKYDDAPDFDFNHWAASRWQAPFCMDNDARLATVGEWRYGAAKGYNNVVMVTIGTGIGTGVIIDGKVLHGAHFQAGSLGGHFVVDYRSRKCSCGNIGCVEALASSYFLPAIIREHESLSAEFKERARQFDFRQLFTLANTGDPEATLLRNDCMDVWSAALITYIHAYDPSVIVVGGGIMNSADVILPYLRERVGRLAWCPSGSVDIVASQLGDHAALLGIDHRLNQVPAVLSKSART